MMDTPPWRCVGLAALLCAIAPGSVRAQHATAEPSDSVRRELAALRAELDSLRTLLAGLGAGGVPTSAARPEEDPISRLRAAAAAEAEGPQPEEQEAPRFEGRQRALQALNPELSVGGDMLSLWQVDGPAGENFLLREVEFALQATLDPFSRAKIIASHHAHGGAMQPFEAIGGAGAEDPEADDHEHTSGVAVEEAYAQWVNLPGGFSLTVGRFRQRLGTYNRWHRHALPWSGLPLAYTVLVGDEGLAQTGASLYWLAPVSGYGTYEVWIEGTRSGNEQLFGSSKGISVLGHVNAFFELSPSTYLELATSAVGGDFESETAAGARRVFHAEAGLSWRPPGRELYRELTVRGAWLRSRGPTPGGVLLGPHATTGGFIAAEGRLARGWLAGLRYDRIEDPASPGSHAWMLVPTLTWWQSEFVRLRVEYDRLWSPAGSRGQVLAQLSFAMGPHKHETY
jgi:hypothetical protein